MLSGAIWFLKVWRLQFLLQLCGWQLVINSLFSTWYHPWYPFFDKTWYLRKHLNRFSPVLLLCSNIMLLNQSCNYAIYQCGTLNLKLFISKSKESVNSFAILKADGVGVSYIFRNGRLSQKGGGSWSRNGGITPITNYDWALKKVILKVNQIISAVHIYWRNPQWKTSFFVQFLLPRNLHKLSNKSWIFLS